MLLWVVKTVHMRLCLPADCEDLPNGHQSCAHETVFASRLWKLPNDCENFSHDHVWPNTLEKTIPCSLFETMRMWENFEQHAVHQSREVAIPLKHLKQYLDRDDTRERDVRLFKRARACSFERSEIIRLISLGLPYHSPFELGVTWDAIESRTFYFEWDFTNSQSQGGHTQLELSVRFFTQYMCPNLTLKLAFKCWTRQLESFKSIFFLCARHVTFRSEFFIMGLSQFSQQ
jgi:hypothetical protein